MSHDHKTYELTFTDVVPDTSDTGDAFRFAVKTAAWEVNYEARVVKGRLTYACLDAAEIMVVRCTSEQPLSAWLNVNGLVLILDDDRIIEEDLIYKPTWSKDPFERSQLTAIDWAGVTFSVESQTKDKLPQSIQYRALERLKQEPWDIVLDDDGNGEIADIVALRTDPEGLLVKLIHCKYSHGATAGARVDDLYEVCGQAQKSIMWRRNDLDTLFRVLDDRARKKQKREGVSPFEVGDIRKLYELRDRATVLRRRVEMVIAQPGLSVERASLQQLEGLSS